MNTNFQTVNILNDITRSFKTGNIELKHNSLTWQISLVEGKIKSATHSLQSAQTIKYYLRQFDCDISEINFLSKNNADNIELLLQRLEKEQYINYQQKKILIKKITEDAIETLFWLTYDNKSLEINKQNKLLNFEDSLALIEQNLWKIETITNNVYSRLELWQTLYPIIQSPHQRPVCKNLSILEKSKFPHTISLNNFKKLIQLMRGFSIRELAFLVKKDELKLAQLLSNYIKQGVLFLHPPKSPLNLLPLIPRPIYTEELKEVKQEKPVLSKVTIPEFELEPSKTKYNIICIDDSPAMLDIIDSYLEEDQYNVITITDPMKSLSYLFKSNPDLIIMDISMPGINGNRLCKILKSSSVFKDTPIILISGETNITYDILKSTGAIDFLPKPFEKKVLINLINKYC